MLMVLSASLIAIFYGFICVFDGELARSFHEADDRIFGWQLMRGVNWETRMIVQGFALIVLGAIGVVISLGVFQTA